VIPENVNTLAAIGLAAFGLASGVAFGRFSARDTLAAARRLASAGATYFSRAEAARRVVLAVETPTMAMPIVELEAATRTRAEKLRAAATEAVERAREAVKPEPGPRDWAPGEMTEAFRRIVDDFDPATPELTLPVQPSPWVHPLAVRGPVPQIVHAPRETQPAPRWETRPAPVPRADTPSRARVRRGETPSLPGRLRAWGGSLLGPVPTLPEMELPRPFQMPVPRPRLPHDPRRMAMLPADDSRQWRVKVAS
jgi:hypothetical protein